MKTLSLSCDFQYRKDVPEGLERLEALVDEFEYAETDDFGYVDHRVSIRIETDILHTLQLALEITIILFRFCDHSVYSETSSEARPSS